MGLISLIDSPRSTMGCDITGLRSKPRLMGRPRLWLSGISQTRATLDALLAIYNGDQKAVSAESTQLSPRRTNWPVFFSDKWLVTSMGSLGFRRL